MFRNLSTMQAVLSVQIIAEYMWSRSDTDKQLLWIVKKNPT